MKTYQDLTKCVDSLKGEFCLDAITEFRGSAEYSVAKSAESYYAKHNETIEKYVKMLRTISGREIPDLISANYKLKTSFFRRLVVQQCAYLLGNGITLKGREKDKLGPKIDNKVHSAAKSAMVCGVSYLFWNLDHLEVFELADTPSHPGFCPLVDEDTAGLGAGIRFWYKRTGDHLLTRYTLYEEDGYTEYAQKDDEKPYTVQEKRAYKRIITATEAEGIISEEWENYGRLPIIPLYANDTHESEIVGLRESIDAYDFIKSGFANNIDDADGFYWMVKNAGGMEDPDLAQLVHRLKTTHAAVIDAAVGGDIQATTLPIPTEARSKMLEILRNDIYEDAMLLDMKQLSAAQKTTQEIEAAYQLMDWKVDDFEYQINTALMSLFALAGVKGEPTFNRQKVTNTQEYASTLLSFANYLSDEMIIRKNPLLTPEEAEGEIKKHDSEQVERFNNMQGSQPEEEPEEEDDGAAGQDTDTDNGDETGEGSPEQD